MRNEPNGEARLVDLSYGQRNAIHSDAALVDNVAHVIRRWLDPKKEVLTTRLNRFDHTRAIDMARDKVSPPYGCSA